MIIEINVEIEEPEISDDLLKENNIISNNPASELAALTRILYGETD